MEVGRVEGGWERGGAVGGSGAAAKDCDSGGVKV